MLNSTIGMVYFKLKNYNTRHICMHNTIWKNIPCVGLKVNPNVPIRLMPTTTPTAASRGCHYMIFNWTRHLKWRDVDGRRQLDSSGPEHDGNNQNHRARAISIQINLYVVRWRCREVRCTEGKDQRLEFGRKQVVLRPRSGSYAGRFFDSAKEENKRPVRRTET